MNRNPLLGLSLAMMSLLTAPLSSGAGDLKDSDWGQWRGPKRDGISPDTGLLKQWPAGGPALAWKVTGMGTGFSSVSILGDRLYTMGEIGDDCAILALNVADGKLVWKGRVGPMTKVDYQGTRCTPSTDGKVVIATSQSGDITCVSAADGKEIWHKNFDSDFGGKQPHWGFSESPLLDGDAVVFTPGSKGGAIVVALNKTTGEKIWQSDKLKGSVHYTSLTPAEIGGVKQYLVLTDGSVSGIGAKDGKVLWSADRRGRTAVIPDPIYKDGLVFVTSGYGVGCNIFKVTAEGGAFKAEEIYSDEKAGVKEQERTANHHGGMILLGDHLYGTNERNLRCVELKTGKVVWENKCVGKGSIAYADGHFVVRSERGKGEIALVEASPEAYKETGRFEQPDRSKQASWPHPVIFGGKMYIRDQDVLLCYDVKAK